MAETNIIVAGVGGQGILFTTNVIVNAALVKGLNFAQSEVHGLAQRYGSIHTEIRIGKNVKSPLILEGTLDLLIALEPLESMRQARYVSQRTIIVANNHIIPSQAAYHGNFQIPTLQQIKKALEELKPRRIFFINATKLAMDKLGDPLYTNTIMLGAAAALNAMPLTPKDLQQALERVTPPEYRKQNLKAFKIGLQTIRGQTK